MYVATTGGERARGAAHAWLDAERRGDLALPELTTAQVEEQLGLAVDRVMAEGSCHDRALAALAVKQARGDLIEAAFLLRAYRTTLPRFGASVPIDTDRMAIRRRISATYKDLPGGQVLGPTFDYTHRLLDFRLAAAGLSPEPPPETEPDPSPTPRVTELLAAEGLMTMGELAALLRVRPPTASKTVSRLAALGLLERHSEPGDGRVVRVRLTAEGERKAAAIERLWEEVEAEFLEGFDPKERRRLRKSLRKIAKTLAGVTGADTNGFEDELDEPGELPPVTSLQA